VSIWAFAVVELLVASVVTVLVAWADEALANRHAKRTRAPRELTGSDYAEPDFDPTDDEQGGLPAAWAKSRRDTQARTRRNDMKGAGQ
jgi:hypothetical protein